MRGSKIEPLRNVTERETMPKTRRHRYEEPGQDSTSYLDMNVPDFLAYLERRDTERQQAPAEIDPSCTNTRAEIYRQMDLIADRVRAAVAAGTYQKRERKTHEPEPETAACPETDAAPMHSPRRRTMGRRLEHNTPPRQNTSTAIRAAA